MLIEFLVMVGPCCILVEVVEHHRMHPRDDLWIRELREEVVDHLLIGVDHLLIVGVTDVNQGREHGIGVQLAEHLTHEVDHHDEGVGILSKELAEAQIKPIEAGIGEELQPLLNLGSVLGRCAHTVQQIEGLLEISGPKELDPQSDSDASAMSLCNHRLGVHEPALVRARVHDVIETHPLQIIAAILDDPVDDLRCAHVLAFATRPECGEPLDGMEGVHVNGSHAHLRFDHLTEGGMIGGEGRQSVRNHGTEWMMKAVAPRLHECGEPVLCTE